MNSNIQSKPRFHYAWIIFIVSFLMVGSALGFCSSPSGLYLKTVCEDLEIPRGLYSLGSSVRFAATAVINLFFGKFITKFGIRKMAVMGFGFLFLSCAVNALANNLVMVYLGGALLGLGLAWTSTSMVGYVVERWFSSKKGTMMSFILASNGLMGALSAQVLAPIIYSPNEGWRLAYWITAALMLTVGLLVFIFLRDDPKEKGLQPLGTGQAAAKKKRGRDWAGISSHEAFRQPYFYVCLAGVFLTGMLLNGISHVSAAHMEDCGIASTIVAGVTSISSLALLCSKMLTGICYDKFGLSFTMIMTSVAAILAIVLLAFVSNPVMAYAAGFLKSLALPLETVMLPLIAADLFGRRSYAHMMGLIVSFNTLGYGVGNPLMNIFYDLTGTYKGIMLVLGGVMVLVAFAMQYCILCAHKIRKTQEAEEAQKEEAVC